MPGTTTVRPATEPMVRFIRNLLDERDVLPADADRLRSRIALGIDFTTARRSIEWLKARPLARRTPVEDLPLATSDPSCGRGGCERHDGECMNNWGRGFMPADRPARAPYPSVPAGHYAVPSATGNNDLDFYRVDRPTTGRWSGRTFVKRVIGGRPATAIRGGEQHAALTRILEAGIESAAVLYGQQIGRCYRCNRHLTDETSRRLGIGPDCRGRI